MINIPITFINEVTKQYFESTKRNSCICGGFESGKTYTSCEKVMVLLTSFNNYRFVIGRQVYKDLKQTTMKTFEKICPREFISVHNQQDGYMRLKNRSEILWMHLDSMDEQSLKGLEPNSVFLDQPEEIDEATYLLMDSRVGRWDKAVPCPELLASKGGDWPRTPLGNYDVPAYMMLAPNPDVETHWIYQRYHPDSAESYKYKDTHDYFEVSTLDNPYVSEERKKVYLSRDPEWVRRFVKGQWGISEATIHKVLPDNILDVSDDFIRNLISKANIYRVLDHGDASPTCCLWVAAYKHQFYFFNEYYMPGALISEHRRNISTLSEGMHIVGNYADPAIFKKNSQKHGGFWCVADEYGDTSFTVPPLYWQPADNNELFTRNRLNEYLSLDGQWEHPITKEKPAPRLYFIKKNPKAHNFGVEQAIIQTRSARRLKLGEINGKSVYSDERDEKVVDHAYDPVRYFISTHASSPKEPLRLPTPTSFLGARQRMKALSKYNAESAFLA